ncbi:hypothetical protein [Streptococcus agalactiae]|nr:hypothetical protein [Streptococcus agalactiae]CCW40218.1 hypothetical protein MSA_13600 [Streptococcus agalactiae ILRI005]
MIELQNIDKKFANHVILEDFNYQFYEGESYALIEESGSGKATD